VHAGTIANEVRVTAAVRIVRQVQLVAVTATSWISAFYATNERSDAADADTGMLYLIGAAPMVLLAWALQARLPFVHPRAAAHRLVLQVLAAAGSPLRTKKQAGYRAQATIGPVRTDLMTVCRLLERVATVEARAEAAGGVQNVGVLTFRSAAVNLRTFLSNRASLTRSFDDIRDDLLLIATVLAQPRSIAALAELAARMGAFEEDGSLKEIYRATHRNRVAAGLDGLSVGLDRTHQILLRGAVIVLVVLALFQFVTGEMALSDLFKSVKL
jgi:hypothetical protein